MWTIDMKKEGKVYKGDAKPKADVAIILSDDTFLQLSEGKVRLTILILKIVTLMTVPLVGRSESIHDRKTENKREHDACY